MKGPSGTYESIDSYEASMTWAAQHDIPLWCGGMLEAGVGRLHNIAITTLGNFTLPGDTASSSRYWYEDIITPEVVAEDGVVEVSDIFILFI